MIDFATAKAGDVIGEELESDDRGDGGDERVGAGDGDDVVHELGGLVIAFGDDAEDSGTACAAFLDVAEGFVFAGDVASEGDDGGSGLEEGDGAVFEFRGVIAFGVDVGDFLEFERAFEGDGIHGAAADEEGVFVFLIGGGDGCDGVRLGDDAGDE